MDTKYIAIDLKSFYASVECVELGLNPLNTNLVVADKSRTNKTICLAVSSALKSFGVPGRPRLFEVEQIIKKVNEERKIKADIKRFKGGSYKLDELTNPTLGVQYIVAKPRMAFYLNYSTKIYNIYLRYIAPEDIHVYSIDEVFIDVSKYLRTYKLTAHELARKMVKEVLNETGITATVGIGTNLYLAKVAMDIVAKHIDADEDGVRIAELDEMSYRKLLWSHEPITDFWRVGHGYAKKLAKYGLKTMGDVARFSLNSGELLYTEFGINAELLIDHAWGYESCTMSDIKSYKPVSNSISSGQVLMEPYPNKKAKIIIKEMCENLVLDMVEKGFVTNNVGLMVGYDVSNDLSRYKGIKKENWYGKEVAKSSGGSLKLNNYTSSTTEIMEVILAIFNKKVDSSLLIRRINISFNNLINEKEYLSKDRYEQFDLFSKNKVEENLELKKEKLEKEKKIQQATIEIKKRFGKNSLLKGINFEEGATGKERNNQIGGHKK